MLNRRLGISISTLLLFAVIASGIAWAVSPPLPASSSSRGRGDASSDPFSDAPDQDNPEQEMPDEDIGGGDDETPDDAEAALSKLSAESRAVLDRHMSLKSQPRAPAGVLQSLAVPPKPIKGKDAAAREQMQKFQRQIFTGDWIGVKKHLANLPAGVGPHVYTHMLELLTNPEKPVTLLTEEIMPLADASPAELTPKQLTILGQLLKKSLGSEEKPRGVLTSLTGGTERLGGEDPKRRQSAARLLLAAGLLEDAQRFMPPLAQPLNSNDAVLLNLHTQYLQALHAKAANPQAVALAWLLTQTVLEQQPPASPARLEAMRRAIALFDAAPPELTQPWLATVFNKEPALGMSILAEIGKQVQTASGNGRRRNRKLLAQKQVIDQLLESNKDDLDPWRTAIEMLTLGWLAEAERLTTTPATPNEDEMDTEDDFAAPSRAAQLRRARNQQARNQGAMDPKDLAAAAPQGAWLAALGIDLAKRVERASGLIAVKADDRATALAAIAKALPTDPQMAQQFATGYLEAWSTKLGNSNSDPYTSSGRYYPRSAFSHGYGGYSSSSDGISLTRARQVRNLGQFAELLAALSATGLPTLEAAPRLKAFAACHSPAEVYLAEDIENIFGPIDELDPDIAVGLATQMRGKLATQWRQPAVQQRAGAKRTDAEQIAEVMRGYELALGLLRSTASRAPQHFMLLTMLAATQFDRAEFAYAQQVDLKTYSTLRDGAFELFGRAAEAFSTVYNRLPPEKAKPEVFQLWFQAALGASDLAYLSPNHETNRDQIELVRAAIMKLPGRGPADQLKLFGEALTSSANQIPPQLKPRFFREALRIMGDDASGKPVRDKLQLYDELLAEIQFNLAIEGSAEVGQAPFGVQLSIRSTKAMGRESDHFQQLMQMLQATQMPGSQGAEARNKLNQDLHEKFDKAFEFQTIRYHDPTVEARGFGRPGWTEQPLAYLVLKAKDPAADRLPSVQLDLTFNDGGGEVLLPVNSQVVLLNANAKPPAPRPVSDLKIRQLLDDRQLGAGLLRLEINASAKGLIPDLDKLVPCNGLAGFRVKGVEDHGLEIASFDANAAVLEPLCERSWLVELTADETQSQATFAFPQALDSAATVTYQAYDDADIVDTTATTALHRPLLADRRAWWIGGGLVALAIAITAIKVLLSRRKSPVDAITSGGYQRPEHVTPFNLVVLLNQICNDPAVSLNDSERRGLRATISDLEKNYFADKAPAPSRDLDSMLDPWLARAMNGSARRA